MQFNGYNCVQLREAFVQDHVCNKYSHLTILTKEEISLNERSYFYEANDKVNLSGIERKHVNYFKQFGIIWREIRRTI